VCNYELEPAARYPGLLICEKCKFLTANNHVDDEQLKKIYDHDYFHGNEYGNYITEKEALKINFNNRIETITKLEDVSINSNVFEIGCAYGYFLELIKDKFNRVSGMDISDDAVNHAINMCNVEAFVGDNIKGNIGYTPDVICMWDVIEHLSKPDKIIEQAQKALNKRGYICITTGDIGSLVAKIRGKHWRMIHPPTHLHYFSKKTISIMLEKKGFEIVSITYPPIIRTLGMILHGIFSVRLKADSVYKKMSILPLQDLPFPINLYDIMFVIARKI